MSIQTFSHYYIGNREIVPMGDYVVVCWDVTENRTYTENGYTVTFTRNGEPYIDLTELLDVDGEIRESDDWPVSSGMSSVDAEQLIKELQVAISFIKDFEKAT